jgi:murein DD-endopeptidase MepM/ murein hydrolase activator NlpD
MVFRDNLPGNINNYSILGNYLIIRHSKQEFSVLAHLRRGSLKAKAGDRVATGQKIGECGNSGYSSDPHLHYYLQSSDVFACLQNFEKVNVAMAVKAHFSDVNSRQNGKKVRRNLYSPVKDDRVSRA